MASSGVCVLPAGVWSRFEATLGVGLPHAVGELVADGRHDLEELQRPLVQVQRSDPGQVGAQVPVDARALDADQGPEVQTRPVRVWTSGEREDNISRHEKQFQTSCTSFYWYKGVKFSARKKMLHRTERKKRSPDPNITDRSHHVLSVWVTSLAGVADCKCCIFRTMISFTVWYSLCASQSAQRPFPRIFLMV